jgi:hypothetical protein
LCFCSVEIQKRNEEVATVRTFESRGSLRGPHRRSLDTAIACASTTSGHSGQSPSDRPIFQRKAAFKKNPSNSLPSKTSATRNHM